MLKAGDPTAARKELDQVLVLGPKDSMAYFWRAKLLTAQGVTTDAINDLNTAVALDPNYSEAWSELADLYAQTGRPQQAAAVLAKLKKIKASAQSPNRNPLLRSLPDVTH